MNWHPRSLPPRGWHHHRAWADFSLPSFLDGSWKCLGTLGLYFHMQWKFQSGFPLTEHGPSNQSCTDFLHVSEGERSGRRFNVWFWEWGEGCGLRWLCSANLLFSQSFSRGSCCARPGSTWWIIWAIKGLADEWSLLHGFQCCNSCCATCSSPAGEEGGTPLAC